MTITTRTSSARRMPRVVYRQNRHYGGGLRIFRSMPNGTRFSLGLMLPDGTVIPPKTAPGPIETTRGLSIAQEREARKAANRAARLKAAAEAAAESASVAQR